MRLKHRIGLYILTIGLPVFVVQWILSSGHSLDWHTLAFDAAGYLLLVPVVTAVVVHALVRSLAEDKSQNDR